ncbi:VWA domain-containing protein [Desulfomicrobium sp. ZS1]|uniref:cobaltochelatase CobT-related protein n=1 Tax=Desulfomicrobium sp. ZS1 TaxID=2952228 RepID=UPI0020B3FA91|nr:VWA domain-containing protein [Desulfomicrobium sp. ZS1]UTF50644.1 VWA domain-containing protein [Desulfomicrobium sp. ZS1]
MIDTRAVMRSLPLVASVLGRKYGVKVEMGGADAYTDGKTIHLPAMPSKVPDTLLAMVRGFLDHEAGHVRETDFTALQEARLSPIEMHVWNTLEDWRVEHRLAALFPGCRHNFDWLIAHLFGSNDWDEPTEPAANILNWLLLEVRSWDVLSLSRQRGSLARQVDRDFPGIRAKIERVLKLVRTKCVSTHDAIKYAREIVRALDRYANHVSKPEASGQAGPEEQNAPSGPCASSEAKSGDMQNNDEKHTEMGRESSRHTDIESESVQSCSPPSSHPPCPMGTDGRGADSQARNELQRLIRAGEDELPPNLGNILASVLKESSRDSVQSSITVAVQTSKNAGPLSGDDIKEARQASTALRTRLGGLLQTTVLSRVAGGRRGRLDTGQLHRLAVSDPRVFRTKSERTGIDTAVHILLDCSGSMVRRIHLACQACYAVASALEASRINVAVSAFPGTQTPDGSYSTIAPVIRHGQKVTPNLDLSPAGGTPMGEALWWVMQEMLPLAEKRKLVLIVTDGDPDSVDCAIQAIEQGLRAGFEIYGIGITSQAIMGLLPGRSVVVNAMPELAPAMFTLLENAILIRREA